MALLFSSLTGGCSACPVWQSWSQCVLFLAHWTWVKINVLWEDCPVTFNKSELSHSVLNSWGLDSVDSSNACVCHFSMKCWSTGVKYCWSQLHLNICPMLYRRISHLTCKSSNFQDNVGSNVSHCALRPNWLPAGIQKKFLVWCDVLQSYQHGS